MFGKKLLDARALGAVRQLVNRRIAFTNGDDLLCGDLGQDFAETPNAALVSWFKRLSPVAPQLLQGMGAKRCGAAILPAWKNDFEKIAAMFAAKAIGKGGPSATYAAQL
jgi:hypothetical protein